MKYPLWTVLVLTLILLSACVSDSNPDVFYELKLTKQQSGTDVLLVGVSAVSKDIVWASGAKGTVLRTVDGGDNWLKRSIQGTDSLQFRDVYAVDANTAYVLSIGKGSNSRIYKTTDGGNSWSLQFKSNIADTFFDCMAFWNPEVGIAFSDAVNGEFVIIKTTNGGQSWERIPQAQLPNAQTGETSFAASGTCVATQGESMGWIGTGNVAQPRVLRTTDRGETWEVYPVPLDAGSGAGATSLIFRDTQHGLVFGGDIPAPATSDSSAAITTDGGATWQLIKNPPLNSPVYGSAYVPGTRNIVAVGPGGVAFSPNEGVSWQHPDTVSTWGATFANSQNGWLVGPEGRIIHVRVQ